MTLKNPNMALKQNHSTHTIFLHLQSLISRAVDGDMYTLMVNLDFSAAFDIVNVDLLLKCMTIIDLLPDLVKQVSNWLTHRYFYVSIDGKAPAM